jgi:hypothetical protein
MIICAHYSWGWSLTSAELSRRMTRLHVELSVGITVVPYFEKLK